MQRASSRQIHLVSTATVLAAWVFLIAHPAWPEVELHAVPGAGVVQRVAQATPQEEPGASEYTITLDVAMRLAGAENLDVRLASERLLQARAEELRATLRFFPWLTPSLGYRRHDGKTQDIVGDVFNVSKQTYNAGVGLNVQLEIGEALYQSLATRQLARAEEEAVAAQRQEAVFSAASEYFELLRQRAHVGVLEESRRLSEDYARQVQSAVDAGIAFKGDALRVRAQAESSAIALHRGHEQRRLAATRLAQTLHLDPSIDLAPDLTELIPLPFAEKDTPREMLLARAIAARPELRQLAARRDAAALQRDAARTGPWIPAFGAQAFAGGLGGGRNATTGNFSDTLDLQLGATWRIGPGGIGDPTRVDLAAARLRQEELELERLHERICRQVVDAYTRVHSLRERIPHAQNALAATQSAFELSRQRRELGVGVVLETVLAEQELTRTRGAYLDTVTDFNRAQLELTRAIGATTVDPDNMPPP